MIIDLDQHSWVFIDQLISSLPDSRDLVSLTFRHCTSKSWSKIGRELASITTLRSLVLSNCNVGDAFCQELSAREYLSCLRLGICSLDTENCGISEKGIGYIAEMRVVELVIGKPLGDLDEPAAQTKEAYECISRKMSDLKSLEMREPTLQVVNLRTDLLIQMRTESGTSDARCSSRT